MACWLILIEIHHIHRNNYIIVKIMILMLIIRFMPFLAPITTIRQKISSVFLFIHLHQLPEVFISLPHDKLCTCCPLKHASIHTTSLPMVKIWQLGKICSSPFYFSIITINYHLWHKVLLPLATDCLSQNIGHSIFWSTLLTYTADQVYVTHYQTM